jgi:nucleotide-binding universal stress UspA family protein
MKMTRYAQRPVVVGVDGSEGSRHALGLAAAEAAMRRLPLRIVHVAAADVTAARTVAASAAARVLRRFPDLPVEVHVARRQRPGAALVDESANAALTVLGSRGLRGLAATLAGSVSSHLACRGYGPVVVVRGNRFTLSGGPIVVGVDGSADCDGAVGFAFEEAALRGVPLQPTLVWVHPPLADLGSVAPPGYGLADAEQDAAAELEAALVGWRQKYPEVLVQPTLVHSRHPARKLLAATAEADLIVAGSKEHSEVRGLLGGSVGHTLVHHAHCPVAVVHGERAH